MRKCLCVFWEATAKLAVPLIPVLQWLETVTATPRMTYVHFCGITRHRCTSVWCNKL